MQDAVGVDIEDPGVFVKELHNPNDFIVVVCSFRYALPPDLNRRSSFVRLPGLQDSALCSARSEAVSGLHSPSLVAQPVLGLSW